MSNRYRIRYVWTTDANALKSRSIETFGIWTKDFEAPTPISAINQFHKHAQLVKELANDRRTVLRPMLKPDQYKVFSVHQFYHDCAFQKDISSTPIVESSVDYPRSPNPALQDHHVDGLARVPEKVEIREEFDFGPDNATD